MVTMYILLLIYIISIPGSYKYHEDFLERYEIDRMGFVVILTMIPVLNTIDSIKYIFRK